MPGTGFITDDHPTIRETIIKRVSRRPHVVVGFDFVRRCSLRSNA